MDTRLLHPWDFLGKSTGVGCHFLLQGIFLTQGLSPGLPNCSHVVYHLSHLENPVLVYLLKTNPKYPYFNTPAPISCRVLPVLENGGHYGQDCILWQFSEGGWAANTPGSWKDECLSPGREAGLCTTASTVERSFKDGRNISIFWCWEEESRWRGGIKEMGKEQLMG